MTNQDRREREEKETDKRGTKGRGRKRKRRKRKVEEQRRSRKVPVALFLRAEPVPRQHKGHEKPKNDLVEKKLEPEDFKTTGNSSVSIWAKLKYNGRNGNFKIKL